jgi:ribose/xylose/arabinose/galactoside ABC-type transport system permease subunit
MSLRFPGMGLLAFLLAMGGLFSALSPYFLTFQNLTNILVQSAVHMIVAVGITLVMATAGIDLSVGAVLALSGIVAAGAMKSGLDVAPAMGLGLAAGAGLGLINGFGVARLSISPFIVTLGTGGIYRALSLIFTEARPIYGMPLAFRVIGTGQMGPLPASVALALAVVGLAYFIVGSTRFGTHARAVGDSPEGAFRMGVPVARTQMGVYTLSGAAAALAGMLVTARLNTAEAIAGWGIELEAIAAVVIGGTSFSGGEARIVGTLLGALVIGTLNNGLTLCNVPSYYQQLVVGLVFVCAVLADRVRGRTRYGHQDNGRRSRG